MQETKQSITHDPPKRYRINKGVTPYGGRILHVTIERDDKVIGRINNTYKTTAEYVYRRNEVTEL